MTFLLEVDNHSRISVNGIRFSKRMTLEEVIEEMQSEYEEISFDDDDEQIFLGEEEDYEEEEMSFDEIEEIFDDEYVEGYNPSTGKFDDNSDISEDTKDLVDIEEPVYFDGIIDDWG